MAANNTKKIEIIFPFPRLIINISAYFFLIIGILSLFYIISAIIGSLTRPPSPGGLDDAFGFYIILLVGVVAFLHIRAYVYTRKSANALMVLLAMVEGIAIYLFWVFYFRS